MTIQWQRLTLLVGSGPLVETVPARLNDKIQQISALRGAPLIALPRERP